MKRMTTWLKCQYWIVLKVLTSYIGSVCVFLTPFADLSFRTSMKHTLKLDFYLKNRRELSKLWCVEVYLMLNLSSDFAHLIFIMTIWLNNLSRKVLDIGAHIHISIMRKAGFHWGLPSLRSKILHRKS